MASCNGLLEELHASAGYSAREKEKLLATFHDWDLDGNGFISENELQAVFVRLGLPATDADRAFRHADANWDGHIDYEEFVRWLFSGSAPVQAKEAALKPAEQAPQARPGAATTAAPLAAQVAPGGPDGGSGQGSRFWHFSARRGACVQPPQRPRDTAARCEFITAEGGATSVAWTLWNHQPSLRVGLMIAGNSGRPGGGCGLRGAVDKVHPHHTTQEEDVVSNWLRTEAGFRHSDQNKLFQETIDKQWGLEVLKSSSPATFQGVDYTSADDPWAYADAWVVRECKVCYKVVNGYKCRFDFTKCAPCHLVFCSGPNCGAAGSPEGSMVRTRNRKASHASQYGFFKECVAAALRAGLDAMIMEQADVALVARLSCGIYAGPHRERINAEFGDLVNSILEEQVGTSTRGHHFARVIVPMLTW